MPRFPAPVVVMGVSGSGKTTVGRGIADALGLPYVEGDDLHPPANVEKMRAGTPLGDADRAPWLDLIGERLAEGPAVVACSALKRAYRDRLRAAAPGLRLVYLRGEPDLLRERMTGRPGHFMPVGLLESQLATLEEPGPDEHPVVVDIARPLAETIATAVAGLAAV